MNTKTDPKKVLAALLTALMVGDSDGANNPDKAITAISGNLDFSSAEGELEGCEANQTIVNIAIYILAGAGYNAGNLVADGVWGDEGAKALEALKQALLAE